MFFILPFLVLLGLYTVIAIHLMNNPGITSHGNRSNVLKYRKQVIFMLGVVVISFFICLLPFRALTLWIIIVPVESVLKLGIDGYYSLLYFCRIMLYINSALNPILYNLMSSKFREGFLKLFGCQSVVRHKLLTGTRKGTFHTTSTNLSSSQSGDKRKSGRIRDDSETITGSIIIKNGVEEVLMSGEHERFTERSNSTEARQNGFVKRKRSTFENIEESIEETAESDDGGLDGGLVTNRRRVDKEVVFVEQNGHYSNTCQSKRIQYGLSRNLRTTSKLSSNYSSRRSESIESSVIEIDTTHHVNVHRIDSMPNDEVEIKCCAQHSIGTESFV